MEDHLVVLGGGQSAVQTIHSARQLGFEGRITLVADEPVLPYQRPPLSKHYLAGKLPAERLLLRPESFYASRDVGLLLGRRAASVDLARQRALLDDGSELEFSALLFATGSRPRTLGVAGADLDGVHYLRTLHDVDSIAAALAPGQRLVVVGGGYIGLEVAAVAVGLGLEVTVLEAGERVLNRVVAPELSAFYTRLHVAAGVRIVCNAQVSGVRGDSSVQAVETADGNAYAADQVIIGIGVVPNDELALAAGLPAADGIRVDATGRTRADGVFAAGDCTRYVHPAVGSELRLESVHNAIGQGKAVASALVGEPQPFAELPWFWSDQYDLKLQIAGIAANYDRTVLRGEPESRSFALFYLRNDVPVAVDCVSNPQSFMAGKKLIAGGKAVDSGALADTGVELMAYADSLRGSSP